MLAKKIGDPTSDASLADLAEVYAGDDPSALATLVNDVFRTTATSKNQDEIATAPWLRIYTTNFDDAVEFSLSKARIKVRSFSFEDDKPRKLYPGTIVHLHGTVRDVDRANVISRLVLGESAYVRQHLERSHWYDQFLYDLKFADSCFFVGYSLADQHIAALLMQSPQAREKTYFIEPDRIPSRVFASRVSKYGEIEPIGLDGFGELCRTRTPPPRVSTFHELKGFRVLETHADKKATAKPTIGEVRDFLIYGRLNGQRLLSTFPQPTYAIPREVESRTGLRLLETNRSLVVDSRLGNGKTVFGWLLFQGLALKGFTCVGLRPTEEISQRDIDFLNSQKNLVVLIENYSTAQDMISKLGEILPNAKFIVEVRTSIYEVRLFEIESKIPRPYARLSLNRLSDQDYADFGELCRRSGISINIDHLKENRAELRDLLISVFESQAIRDKIKEDLSRSFESDDARRVIITSFLLQLVQASIDPEYLRLVTRVDPFSVLRLDIEGTEEFFSLANSDIVLRSPVFAEFAMREFISSRDLADAVHDNVVFCSNRKDDLYFRRLLSSFMQYSRLRDVFAASTKINEEIKAVYERLRWYPNIEDEPLFWLQYAILEIDESRLDTARDFIGFAYARAGERDNYLTYQIDTQYLRLLILIIKRDGMSGDHDLFDDFVKYIGVVAEMVSAESHRGYSIKVLEEVPNVIADIAGSLGGGEKLALGLALEKAHSTLSSLSPEFSSQSGSAVLDERFREAIASIAT